MCGSCNLDVHTYTHFKYLTNQFKIYRFTKRFSDEPLREVGLNVDEMYLCISEEKHIKSERCIMKDNYFI